MRILPRGADGFILPSCLFQIDFCLPFPLFSRRGSLPVCLCVSLWPERRLFRFPWRVRKCILRVTMRFFNMLYVPDSDKGFVCAFRGCNPSAPYSIFHVLHWGQIDLWALMWPLWMPVTIFCQKWAIHFTYVIITVIQYKSHHHTVNIQYSTSMTSKCRSILTCLKQTNHCSFL